MVSDPGRTAPVCHVIMPQAGGTVTVPEKLVALRQQMAEQQIEVYVIPSSDPHQNEYVSAHFSARAWLSGFTGSAGTLAVSTTSAGLWVDSRYWLEAELVLKDSGIQLFCLGKPEVPTLPDWIANTQASGSRVSYDARCVSMAFHQELERVLKRRQIQTVPGPDLLTGIWTDRPALSMQIIAKFDQAWVGASYHEKMERISYWLQEQGIQWYVVSSTDEICWLLNLRGKDIEFNPVFHAYLLVGLHGHVLFIGEGLLPEDIAGEFAESGISLAKYGALDAYLQTLPSEDQVLLPPVNTSMQASGVLGHLNQIVTSSPVTAWKAIKHPLEQAALRTCLQRDGVALVKFLYWLEKSVEAQSLLDEFSIGQKIAEFRALGEYYQGESFNPIVGFGGNGAIVHYHAPAVGSAAIGPGKLLLIDCGGQYLDGTTDITRIVCTGKPSPSEIEAYTLVLKGHIRLATVHFPLGTFGGQLDILARSALWEKGWNYGHGTGHGIGFFLNVHEGPQRIAPGPSAMEAPLESGNLLSNEPGIYINGQFGIRIENMILVQDDPIRSGFLQFETLTLCPYERSLIDPGLLSPEEEKWLNEYHETVYKKLSKGLNKEEAHWLHEQTRPI